MVVRRMPPDVREQVARRILDRAVEAGWEDLNAPARSAMYARWVTDPDIGGEISQYLPPERVRVWIKDGPMKEYQRARRGLGPYAKYVPTAEPMEGKIIKIVLGEGWHVIEGSIAVKPSRFVARNERDDDEVAIVWGTPADLKHIVWAWLNASRLEDVQMVVLPTASQPFTADSKALVRALQERLHTTIRVIER